MLFRSLEVYRATGKPISALHSAQRRAPPFELRAFALMPLDRAQLHLHIAARFDRMLQLGLIEEVRELSSRLALHADSPGMRCVGYRQVFEYLAGAYGREHMREKAIAATRQLAKRQLTWLRSMPEVEALDPTEPRLAEFLARRIGDE